MTDVTHFRKFCDRRKTRIYAICYKVQTLKIIVHINDLIAFPSVILINGYDVLLPDLI